MSEMSLDQIQLMPGGNPTGYITGLPVSSLIQVLELERKTCTLQVFAGGKKGSLYVRRGVVLDAETDTLRGEDAAISILGWESAQIKIVESCNVTDRVIQYSLTRLILDASRRKDEQNAAKDFYSDLQQAICLIEGNHFKEAHALITNHLKTNPTDCKAWLWFSRCLGSLQAISAALAKCTQLAPDNLQVIEELRKLEHAYLHVKASPVRRCPFCWSPLDRIANHCHYCKAKLIISQALRQNSLEQVESKFLIDAITRYTDVVAREKNVKAMFYLSLANCNLNKVEEALDLLNEASRGNPDNKFLSDQLTTVVNHMAARLTIYENTVAAQTKEAAPILSAVQPKKKKILVVEDSPTTRKVIVLTLKPKGYTLVEAQDGLEALSKIDQERPDLILLDIILPKMDGYRILSIIRKSPELRDTPVILLTSKDSLMSKVKGKLAGSTAYLTKPFEPKDLVEAVRKHIR